MCSYVILAAILNYVVDGYGHYSASALGGVVFVRNIVSPLVAETSLTDRSAPSSHSVSTRAVMID